jgi:radical SAM protein with 4Fe4S-binding SPASM domain
MFEAVEIEINSHCNKACSYCPNSAFERVEKGFISDELFLTILTQLRELDFKGKISFSFYNEPLLNKHLDSYVKLTKKYLPFSFIEIYTNGSLLTKQKIEDLLLSGVDLFTITRHEDVIGTKLEEILESLSKMEAEKIKYRKYNEINLTNRGGILNHLVNDKKTTFLPCKIPEKVVSITLLGNVLPCFEDFFQKNIMGNVQDQHIKEIWNSKKYLEFRNNLKYGLRHKYETCANCSRLEVL